MYSQIIIKYENFLSLIGYFFLMLDVVSCARWCIIVYLVLGNVCGSQFVLQSLDLLPQETPNILVQQYHTATQLSVEDANRNPDLLNNLTLILNKSFHFGSSATAINKMLDYSANNDTFVIGNVLSRIATLTGVVGNVYDVAQFSSIATTAELTNKQKYPYFSRISFASSAQVLALESAIFHYIEQGSKGWNNIAIITSAQEYGLSLAFPFIDRIQNNPLITIASFQQIIPLQEDISVELREIMRSKARVIVVLTLDDWPHLIVEANELGLVGDHFVWIVSDTTVGLPRLLPDENVRNLTRGVIGSFSYYPQSGPLIDSFVERWNSLNSSVYIGSEVPPTYYGLSAYDEIQTAARAITKIQSMGYLDNNERIPAHVWTEALRSISFEGLTGPISFDEFGDRNPAFNIVNYIPERNEWVRAALWTYNEGYKTIEDVIWYSNTTDIPDLDIRQPFDYWSCSEKAKGVDHTGKTVTLHTPDGSSFDDIDYDYYCDSFIDCHNLSDETTDCLYDYVVVYIIFGIITASLILTAFILLLFTIVFGSVFKYTRVRSASSFFLVMILLSVIVGYLSVFAWYGKPHSVACVFRPWLLGLSSISMVSALVVKNYRLWRIFKFPLKKTKITDFELFLAWILFMIPAVIIVLLWTIISTPTAIMSEQNGSDHYVCSSQGFTGIIGGYVFFSILLGYGSIVLLFGIFMTIATRKVPSLFNESKLLAISIYNIGFLCVIMIPTYFVIESFNPFVAWILRTIAVLYAFTATMIVQFVPKVFYVVLVDRCKQMDTSRPIVRSSEASSFSKNVTQSQ